MAYATLGAKLDPEVVKAAGHSADDFILNCWYYGYPCSPRYIFIVILVQYNTPNIIPCGTIEYNKMESEMHSITRYIRHKEG